ncbi:hypothetical protein DFP72DRAFT_1005947 [Ephemerocybe angulata]|uniref:Protein kinase domain-containing protein n=1 Tax=Ephemerocybe angulata TaxID=980116 RepID=A0A8H6I6G8_9AGAR|nr:hypothetical protein DFP72DRAFT_1005947 [Tulosesus angulatus]
MLLYSETHDFLDHYFLPPPSTFILDEVVKQLRRKRVLIPRRKLPMAKPSTSTQHTAAGPSNYTLSGSESKEQPFPLVLRGLVNRASEGRMTRSQSSVEKLWTKLEDLANDIRQCMETAGVQCTGLELSLLPDSRSDSDDDIEDATSESFVETDGQRSGDEPSSYASLDMSVPVAVRVNGESIAQNRKQLMQAMGDILEGDITRNFTYGISIEDDCVSLWYSTRKNTIMATSFSYIERPDLLIRVFLSLFSADREALGYESHITRLADGSYLYELDGTTTKAGTAKSNERLRSKRTLKQDQSFFFKTTHLVSGGHTRIWKAVEVTSKLNLKPKHKSREIILKDTWVDNDSATEFDLQRQMFQDIDALKQSNWESLPILSSIPGDREEFDRLRGYLKDDSYKGLFLRYDERMCYTGLPGKSRSNRLWKPTSAHGSAHSLAENPGPSGKALRPDSMEDAPVSDELRISAKRRCFFVFPETCTRVSNLPTLGDAINVLNQAYYALLIMFCTGWVHRDISNGNILAIEKNGKWMVRLADLEFAKKLSPNLQESSDLRVGTPYFMAYEIQSSDLICPLDHRKLEKPRSVVWGPPPPDRESAASEISFKTVVHTVLHDIESLWWLILWIITSRVSCEASKIAMKAIFRVTNAPSAARTNLLKGFMPNWVQKSGLHDRVKRIGFELDEFREHLYANYFQNTPKMRLDRSNYADICAIPLIFFQNIETSREAWDSLPLQQSTTSIEPARQTTPPIPLVAHDPDEVDATSYRGLSKRKFLDSGAIAAPILNQDGEGHDSGPSKKRRLRHRGVLVRGGA